MDSEEFYGAAYKGSRQFTQKEVKTANATGFGAAADDYMERGIDLNEQLIMNKPATFFFRMTGEAMVGAGIYPNDILVVDRSVKASNGKIIVAAVDGELLVRRLQLSFNKMILTAENKNHQAVEVGEFSQYNAWGVVTCVIHVLDSSLQAYQSNKNSKMQRTAI
ncbi:LexA family protein [Terrimonas pollutisoli]|uniref:LexA family protein n=1 Tax=Terrimonas pollutisoli TaxID=3034147 RepID=UPI0023EDC3B6|nr:translesion error-prone DNA polymerase V autoproteolytic subunit [Terrimonas sp. H1YJ31]